MIKVRILVLYLLTAILVATIVIWVINSPAWQIDILIGLAVFALLGLYTYAFARVVLLPVQRTTERQRRFAGNVAHELRTPLSAMRTNFEVALMGAGERAAGEAAAGSELSDALQSGIEEIDRMSAVTKFLLNFSVSDNPHLELHFSLIDLVSVVHETLRRMQPFIENRTVTVRAVYPKPVMVHGDATILGEMLMNLVKNAIAYTPEGGSVTITAQRERGVPVLSVSDTGIGIPPADLPNIFEPFYRGGNAYSQRTKKRGSGIGLAIVKEIATLHKAHISVESELGNGTTFFIKFPSRWTGTFQK